MLLIPCKNSASSWGVKVKKTARSLIIISLTEGDGYGAGEVIGSSVGGGVWLPGIRDRLVHWYSLDSTFI
jgi:hypothetical protein